MRTVPFPRTGLSPFCHSLREVVKRAGGPGLSLLPYNPHDADQTTWWMVPSSENPAYKFGKYVVRRSDRVAGGLLLGLEVEKGVGPGAAPAFSSPKGRSLVLQPDWLWPEFVSAIRDETFGKAIVAASSSAGVDVAIRVSLGFLSDPGPFLFAANITAQTSVRERPTGYRLRQVHGSCR